MKHSQVVALVGNPNVGKSALFNALTGASVTVSNYPGTTVDISRGPLQGDGSVEIVDTPGMYSFLSVTEEERIARRILLDENPGLVINVADARNLERMLVLTLQLLEAELPLFLVLNMIDEAEAAGIELDIPSLSEILRIPVFPTVATTGRGVAEVKAAILNYEYRRSEDSSDIPAVS